MAMLMCLQLPKADTSSYSAKRVCLPTCTTEGTFKTLSKCISLSQVVHDTLRNDEVGELIIAESKIPRRGTIDKGI